MKKLAPVLVVLALLAPATVQAEPAHRDFGVAWSSIFDWIVETLHAKIGGFIDPAGLQGGDPLPGMGGYIDPAGLTGEQDDSGLPGAYPDDLTTEGGYIDPNGLADGESTEDSDLPNMGGYIDPVG